jgi:hypothetical protein
MYCGFQYSTDVVFVNEFVSIVEDLHQSPILVEEKPTLAKEQASVGFIDLTLQEVCSR